MADTILLLYGLPIEILDRGDGTYRFAVELEAGAAAIGSVTVNNAAGSGVYVRPGTAAVFDVDATGQGDVPITLDGETVQLAAGANLVGKTQPFAAGAELGLTELIGVDEQVDQNDYCASVAVALGGTYSGELLNVTLYTTKDGTGAIRTPAGTLFVFDANPSISNGDTAMSAGARVTVVGQVTIALTDWVSDANGASCHKQMAMAFHAVSSLYFAFLLTSANSFNDAAGDDEQMEFNGWYRRDS